MVAHRHNIIVKDDVWKEFKAYIMRKTKDIKKGDLSKWFEIIVKDRIREEQQQQQHSTYDRHSMSKDEEMVESLTDLMKQIKSILWNDTQNPMDISCGNNCHKKILRKAITKVRNIHDRRQINIWFNRLVDFGFIKKTANSQYKILNDGHDSLDIKQEQREQDKQEFDSVMEGLK
jgi:hypothetical protein